MSLAAISALLLVCLVHRGEVSSAPCGEDLGVSLAASLGSRGGSSFPFFLKATTAPVSASRPVSIHCCQSRSVVSKKQESKKRHQSVAPMLLGVHCCQPAPDHSQQACRIHTWQAMGKEKTTPWQASSHRLRTPPWGRFRPWRFDMGVCIFLW